jgi:hypothetical protein
LSTHLHLGLPSGLPSGFSHQYRIYIPVLPHSRYMPCPSRSCLSHC